MEPCTMPYPTQDQVARARTVAANPASFLPMERQLAFATLKAARGQRVNFRTLPAVRHSGAPTFTATPTLVEPGGILSPETRARIHARAAELGVIRPRPTGGDAA
jgi:hypothetical protein